MKIEGPGKSQQTGKKKKTSKTSSPDGSFSDFMTDKAGESKKSSGAQSITAADSLLAVQAQGDPGEKSARQRMASRADRILDKLERIRMQMLSGTLTVGDMIDIADMVARHREKINDADLTAILDEIDLRAQIELAKMRVSLEDANEDERP